MSWRRRHLGGLHCSICLSHGLCCCDVLKVIATHEHVPVRQNLHEHPIDSHYWAETNDTIKDEPYCCPKTLGACRRSKPPALPGLHFAIFCMPCELLVLLSRSNEANLDHHEICDHQHRKRYDDGPCQNPGAGKSTKQRVARCQQVGQQQLVWAHGDLVATCEPIDGQDRQSNSLQCGDDVHQDRLDYHFDQSHKERQSQISHRNCC
mmetsp:Transcript_39237/g.73178  ORF Transcript_39237/g.73178 Transcript_39237/m.73178 type:complete len:207 (+) Transcript_39237:135-755(+)